MKRVTLNKDWTLFIKDEFGIPSLLIHDSCKHEKANRHPSHAHKSNWVDFTHRWTGHDNCQLCREETPEEILKKAKFIINGV